MNTKIFAWIGVLVIIVAAAGLWYFLAHQNFSFYPAACTTEAMECPDGSYVGRTGSNCEFAACPSASSTAVVGASTWETYTNQTIGVTLQYPSAWNLTLENDPVEFGSGVDWLVVLKSAPASAYSEGGVLPQGNASIAIFKDSSDTLQMAEANDMLGASTTIMSNAEVAGISSPEADYYWNDPGNITQHATTVYVSYQKVLYEIILDYYGDPQFLNIFNKLLSTFQFIQPSTGSS